MTLIRRIARLMPPLCDSCVISADVREEGAAIALITAKREHDISQPFLIGLGFNELT